MKLESSSPYPQETATCHKRTHYMQKYVIDWLKHYYGNKITNNKNCVFVVYKGEHQ
jgi:hypothetical protein